MMITRELWESLDKHWCCPRCAGHWRAFYAGQDLKTLEFALKVEAAVMLRVLIGGPHGPLAD